MLSGARRVVMLLLVTLLLTMTAQTAWALDVTYIDENGDEKTVPAIVLNGGGATELTGGLYVVNSNITYTGTVTLKNNVKIILMDGYTMKIGTSEARLSGIGINYDTNRTLTIYGQTNGTGTLSVYTSGEWNFGIYAGAITINGGTVTADTNGSNAYAIYAQTVTINGGHVTAHTAGSGARAIYSRTAAFTYNGGIVSASADDTTSDEIMGYNSRAIASSGNYTFNWRSATDRITIGTTGLYFNPNAPSGYESTATFSKPFSDGTTTYSGTLTGTELNALAGKTLQPAYTITYDLAGGSVATANPTTYTIESAAITLNNPTREGYTFAGWTGTGLDAATTTVTIAHGSSGDRSYTATWKKLLTNTDITVTIPSMEWTGTALTPTITVKDGETPLTVTTDYTVSLPDGRTNSGDYTVTLTGAGNYSGTVEKTFTIVAKTLTNSNIENTGTTPTIALTQDQNGTTATLDGASEGSVSITADVDVNDVKLNRPFNNGQKTCICWPFAVQQDKADALGKFYQFTGTTSEGKIEMTQVTTGGLEANQPYIFEPSGDLTTIDFGAKTLKAGGAQSVGSGFTFKGIYSRVKWTKDTTDPLYDAGLAAELGKAYGFALQDLAGYSVGQFVKLGDGAYSRAFRAYMLYDGLWDGNQPSAGARSRSASAELPEVLDIVWISSSSQSTGIDTVATNRETDEWYSLDGRKLSGKPVTKGLYIHNGNKVAIK